MNRRHDAEQPYLGFIQHKIVSKQELFIIRSTPFYKERQRWGMFSPSGYTKPHSSILASNSSYIFSAIWLI